MAQQGASTHVHPDEQPSWWEILGFWSVVFAICIGFWYAVIHFVIAPIVRGVWPFVWSLIQAYGGQFVTVAVLAVVVLAVVKIARGGRRT